MKSGLADPSDEGINAQENPFLFSQLLPDLHRICPHDKFHVDEDSSGHAPRDLALLGKLLNDKVSGNLYLQYAKTLML